MSTIPNDWRCPISLQVMRDPVIAPDGYTYERTAITTWLNTHHVSPMTRVPMYVTDLIANRALQTTIETYLATHPDPDLPPVEPILHTFTPVPVALSAHTFHDPDGKRYLHVRATPPSMGERQPIVLLPIIDNSGSMGESVGGAGGVEDMGFTRLDLVKHAVRTMVAILGPQDSMGLVSFSTQARVVMAPRAMDSVGKSAINAALDTIRPDASTNIFDGIKKAAELLADPALAGQNIVAMLLTDGFPTVNPPRGLVETLPSLRRPAMWTLHAFGFGYNLDSKLCADIAEWGGGLFGFIPDATMVGTVFINALAHVLSTANLDTTFTYTSAHGAPLRTVSAGPIAYGQPRDYLFEIQGEPTFNGAPVPVGDPGTFLIHHLYKSAIAEAIRICKTGGWLQGQALLAEFEGRFNTLDEPTVKALLKDLRASKEGEGQVGMAPAHFQRWGEHYMRAYLRAQTLQQCMNFKDPGLQIYGGALFHALQDSGDVLFCNLPPPTPSARAYMGSASAGPLSAPVASMSIFHNASGGCFAPTTLIRLADGNNRMITELRRGDSVWTPSGPARVVALVICGSSNRAQPMSMLNGLVITPWHPVRRQTPSGVSASSPAGDEAHPVRRHSGGPWVFPADVAGYVDRLMSTVYNLVLDSGHIVLADGWQALTLGHGFSEPVAAHPYFGTARVVEDLKKQPGWDVGMPRYRNLVATHDSSSGLINGWKDDI